MPACEIQKTSFVSFILISRNKGKGLSTKIDIVVNFLIQELFLVIYLFFDAQLDIANKNRDYPKLQILIFVVNAEFKNL
jgi:hypothetical protein